MSRAIFFLFFTAALGGEPARAAESGIGIVTAVKGTGTPLKQMDPINEQAIRILANGEVIVFMYRGAREYTLRGPGAFVANRTGITKTSASGTLTMKRMDPVFSEVSKARAGVVQAGATLRAAAAPADAQDSDEMIDPARPVLRWPARTYTGGYQLHLTDKDDQVLYRAQTAGNEVSLPEHIKLVPGTRYQLEVTGHEPGGQLRLHTYRFSTLSAHHGQTLERLRPKPDAAPESKVLFGLWLRSLGAWSLARPYLEK